jgi:hypothetical protein
MARRRLNAKSCESVDAPSEHRNVGSDHEIRREGPEVAVVVILDLGSLMTAR